MKSIQVFHHYYQQLNVNAGPTGVDIVDYDVNDNGTVEQHQVVSVYYADIPNLIAALQKAYDENHNRG